MAMMNNMMNNRTPSTSNSNDNSNEDAGNNEGGMPDMSGMPDMGNLMSQMMGGMNPEMLQQMMNSMGGTQAVNQNNPNSREGQMRQKLQKKLANKEKTNE